MVIWFLSWKSVLRVWKLCVRPKVKVGLGAWRRLNHKNDHHDPLRNIHLLERLLAPSRFGHLDVVASMQRLASSQDPARTRTEAEG